MASAILSSTLLHAKFRGSMIGALLGDCLGSPFEGDSPISKTVLSNFWRNLMGESKQIFPFTDDTSMTVSVASSLIEKDDVDVKDMAKRFVDEYYKSPKRGYGANVGTVFKSLRETNFDDVFLPAKMQFNGSGSYGNGAAMRIAPIALFGNSKGEEFIMNAVTQCAHITHTHQNAVNGAILQSLAVNSALGLDSTQVLDPVHFINNLEEKMKNIETKEDISPEEIAGYLGNDVAALRSVPTAIYSFLRGMKPFKEYETSNPLLRTLYFALSIGGDTDTIASMAGSIAGAYYGADLIPDVLQKRCESIDEVIKIADKLFDVAQKKE